MTHSSTLGKCNEPKMIRAKCLPHCLKNKKTYKNKTWNLNKQKQRWQETQFKKGNIISYVQKATPNQCNPNRCSSNKEKSIRLY